MAGLGLNPDQLSVLLGGIGKAIMAPTKDGAQSWQSGIGQLAGDMGSAKILADQANKQRAEQRALIQMLMGGGTAPAAPAAPAAPVPNTGLTPDGVPGPTSKTVQQNADGTFTETVKGNAAMPGTNAPIAPAPKTKGFSLKDILPF